MTENSQTQLFSKKAYEIAYAIFRVSGFLASAGFREFLERNGLALLVAAVSGDWAASKNILSATEYLLRFGADTGVLNRSNTETMLREVMSFNSAIDERLKPAIPEEISLDNIFSKDFYQAEKKKIIPVELEKDSAHQNNSAVMTKENPGYGGLIDNVRVSDNQNGNGVSIVKSAMRQAAIVERIRQNGNCRLKDIQEFLPEVSERTIRYDIQDLIGEGFIERFGSGGPATYYQIRNS